MLTRVIVRCVVSPVTMAIPVIILLHYASAWSAPTIHGVAIALHEIQHRVR